MNEWMNEWISNIGYIWHMFGRLCHDKRKNKKWMNEWMNEWKMNLISDIFDMFGRLCHDKRINEKFEWIIGS